MNSSIFCVILASLFIVTSGSTNTSKDDLLGSVKNALPDTIDMVKNTLSKDPATILGSIPTSLDDVNLPPGINASALPSIEEGEELMRKKCLTNGKNDSFEIAMAAKEELQYCLKDLVSFDSLESEIKKYQPTGDLDIVFKKYCKKVPTFKECVNNFTIAIDPCLDESEKINKIIIKNITESLDKFICFKEGDRIALFIAEGGKECLDDKKEAIQHCLNQTYSRSKSFEVPDLNNVPIFKLEEKECRDINALQLCIVGELEKCNEPTPANIVDSLFNFIRQSTPCASYKIESSTGGSSSVLNTFSIGAMFSLLFSYSLAVSLQYH